VEHFYNTEPLTFCQTEYLKQVGHTINGESISAEQVGLILSRMRSLLDLKKSDTLLDLCCGNGLFTKELAKECNKVVGIDFSTPLLEVAERVHCPDNVTYRRMNALEVDTDFDWGSTRFNKVVMCAALQHFEHNQLEPLLSNLIGLTSAGRVILFLLVPDQRKKWVFYNTITKRMRHLVRQLLRKERIGTWWKPEDFETPCQRLGLHCSFDKMDVRLDSSQFRFDIRIT